MLIFYKPLQRRKCMKISQLICEASIPLLLQYDQDSILKIQITGHCFSRNSYLSRKSKTKCQQARPSDM